MQEVLLALLVMILLGLEQQPAREMQQRPAVLRRSRNRSRRFLARSEVEPGEVLRRVLQQVLQQVLQRVLQRPGPWQAMLVVDERMLVLEAKG